MKYCEIFLRSGEIVSTKAMEESETEQLRRHYKEQTPGVLEFKDEEGVFLLAMADVICVSMKNYPVDQRLIGYETDTA